jgi:predicted transcriptional regulator
VGGIRPDYGIGINSNLWGQQMTFEELIECLDNLAEVETDFTKSFVMSEAAAKIVRLQMIINELEAENQRLQQVARYD